ncbi:peroxisomal membrane protein 11C-like [Saccostrea cucullata]|uniref:peroxisomal membrane protein 11C-like n=1 Tax=Saccostrea cuccullata TaxID=36930 RepID=UPI002ED5C6DB
MELVRMLESYRGRDKIIRLCTYAAMCVGGSGQGNFHKKLLTISAELGGARTTMRLFDDLSMLFSNLKYGTGAQEKNPLVRLMSLVTNITYQIFFPVEHIYWLADKKVLTSFTPWKWVVGSIVAWAVALFADMIKMVAKIVSLKKELGELRKQKLLQSSEESEDQVRSERKTTVVREIQESYLTLIQDMADFTNAISWLPPGLVLWSGKLSRFQNGIFGMISSIILLYKAWPSKQKSS